MSKHTPGPWEANYGGTVGHIKTVADRRDGGTPTVARFDMAADSIPENEREANARLIAAAPDLLKACQDVLDAINNTDLGGEVIWIDRGSPIHESASDRLEAVISQATGEEPQ